MDKKTLRAKYKKLRAALSENQLDDLSIEIANRLLTLKIWDKSYYHIFLPIEKQKEINTEFIMNILLGKDKHIVVSKSNFEDNSLHHVLLTDNTVLKVNEWGIPEPIDGIPIAEDMLQVIFIPLLAFDNKGNRVGYGKGFYDRFLSKCTSETIKIGVSFFDAEPEIEGVNPLDIRLNLCITPQKTYFFKN